MSFAFGMIRVRFDTAGDAIDIATEGAFIRPGFDFRTFTIQNLTASTVTVTLTTGDEANAFLFDSAGGSGFPVADSLGIFFNEADPSRRFRFDASLITPGSTRVATMPDADFLVAGLNLLQTFTRSQTFNPSADENAVIFGATNQTVGSFTANAWTQKNLAAVEMARLRNTGRLVLGRNDDPNPFDATIDGIVRLDLQAGAFQSVNIAQVVVSAATKWSISKSGQMICTTVGPKFDTTPAAAGSLWYSTDVDGNGEWASVSALNLVTTNTNQTISGLKTFRHNPLTANYLIEFRDQGGNLMSYADENGLGWHVGADVASGNIPLTIYNGYADIGFGVSLDPLALSGPQTQRFPDATGTFVLETNAATITNKTFGTTGNNLRSSTASTGVPFQDNTTSSKKLRVVLNSAVGNNALTFVNTAARDFTFPDTITPTVLSKTGTDVDLVASADSGPTNIVTPVAASHFLVSYVLQCTTGAGAAGTVTVTFNWTDNAGATTHVSAAVPLTALGRASGAFSLYRASGSLTYTITHTGIYSTAAFTLRARACAL